MRTTVILSAILLNCIGLFAQETEALRPPGRVIKGISTVTVTKPVVKVKEVSLDNREITLFMDGTAKLSATVSPAGPDNQGIDWRSSSNGAVVKVSDGVVSPVQLGTDTVFAVSRLDAKKFAACVVRVKIDSLAIYRSQCQALNAQLQENDGKVISMQNGKITYLTAHKKALVPDCVVYILVFLLLVLLVVLFLVNRKKNKRIAALEDIKKSLEAQRTLLVKEKNTLISEKETLSAEVNRLQHTNTDLRGEIFSLEQKIKACEETIAKSARQQK